MIQELSIEARMTLCNMAVEFSAFSGLIAPDATTVDYLRDRPHAPKGEALEQAIAQWATLYSDADASFDREISFDCSGLSATVTWGTSPEHTTTVAGTVPSADMGRDAPTRAAIAQAQAYMAVRPGQAMRELTVDAAFIGSCTNSRIEDLRAAAGIIAGHTIHADIAGMIVPGSGLVKEQAEAEGLDRIFTAAGFEWREPGCSMCLAMNADKLRPEERCASTSNCNFEGRQGFKGRTHLVSPEMAAAAAIAGHFVDVREWPKAV